MPENDPNSEKKLNKKQEKFVEEMTNPETKSATEAAIKAGYSKTSARESASENLTKSNVLAAIEKRRLEIARINKTTPAEIYGSAVREMFSTIDDCLDKNGHFDIKKARRTGAVHSIKKLTFREGKYGTSISVEMKDTAAARRELATYDGLAQLPRENARTLAATVNAIRHYLEAHPDADREKVIQTFAVGRKLDPETVQEHLESIQ